MRVIILLVLVGAALAVPAAVPAAVPRHESRIVGGSPATVEEYPFVTNMHYHWHLAYWMQWCGGSLLTSTTILSSARCYYHDTPSEWRALLGSSHTAMSDHIHMVSQVIHHEEFNPLTLANDVAIVRLATPANMNAPNPIGVARIAGPNYNLPDGTSVTALGWGQIFLLNSTFPEQLHSVEMPIINHQVCTELYNNVNNSPGFLGYVTEGMMCAGILDGGGKGACTNDRGGPLVHNGDIIYGITSWPIRCGHAAYPGVFTRVSSYSDWIVQNGST